MGGADCFLKVEPSRCSKDASAAAASVDRPGDNVGDIAGMGADLFLSGRLAGPTVAMEPGRPQPGEGKRPAQFTFSALEPQDDRIEYPYLFPGLFVLAFLILPLIGFKIFCQFQKPALSLEDPLMQR